MQQAPTAAIAQLGERQTEDLKVPGSIPGLGTLFLFCVLWLAFFFAACVVSVLARAVFYDGLLLVAASGWPSSKYKTQRRNPTKASISKQEASRGFEPRSLDSESRVLTVTPRGRMNTVRHKSQQVFNKHAPKKCRAGRAQSATLLRATIDKQKATSNNPVASLSGSKRERCAAQPRNKGESQGEQRQRRSAGERNELGEWSATGGSWRRNASESGEQHVPKEEQQRAQVASNTWRGQARSRSERRGTAKKEKCGVNRWKRSRQHGSTAGFSRDVQEERAGHRKTERIAQEGWGKGGFAQTMSQPRGCTCAVGLAGLEARCQVAVSKRHDFNDRQAGVWRNGSASDSRSEGWEFESLCPHFFLPAGLASIGVQVAGGCWPAGKLRITQANAMRAGKAPIVQASSARRYRSHCDIPAKFHHKAPWPNG